MFKSSSIPSLHGETVRVDDFKEKLQRLSVLAQEFYGLMEETKRAFDKTRSPLRFSYVTLVDEFVHKVMEKHSDGEPFFMTENVLNDLTEICQSRVTRKILQPGFIWDSQITHNVCEMLAHIPSDELQLDKNFLGTVSKLPPVHPIRAGPGTWFCIHTLAKSVKSYEDHMHVCAQIERLMEHFYCPKCKDRFRQYLKAHDPRKLLPEKSSNVFKGLVLIDKDTQKRLEPVPIPKLFIWTVEFHNEVNGHKDDYSGAKTKLKMDILEAWNLYKDYEEGNFTPCLSCVVR